ncbi:MAG TPA: hypothetical protein PLD27_12415, partial [bacterium]|nr:hypothetical protein [bacterium]
RAKIGDEITITALIEAPAGRTIYAGIKAGNVGDTSEINISQIDDTVSVLMNDDGINGDAVAGDSLFTCKITIGKYTSVISDLITIVAGIDTSNYAQAVCALNLDTTAPVISSVRVSDGNGDRVFDTGIELKGTIAQIKAEASDNVGISKIEFSYKLNNADTYILIGEDSEDSYIVGADISAMLTAYGIGPYTLRVRAYDEAGNNSETELVYTIWLDTTAPVISSVKATVTNLNMMIDSNVIDGLTVKGITIFKIIAYDNESSLNRVVVNLIGGEITINKTTLFDTIADAYITYLNIDELAGLDTFILQIKAYDEANNETSIQYELNIWQDNIVPQIRLSGEGLADNEVIREMIYILTASCTDNYNFAKVVFEISESGSNSWVKFTEITVDTTTSEYIDTRVFSCTIPFDVTNLDKSKIWDVRATVFDVYYNNASSSITGLRFDTSIPVITGIETAAINTTEYIVLTEGATLPAAVTIFRANVSDSFDNVESVTFYLKAGTGNYVPISTIYEAPYEVYINVANWTNNLAYTLKVVAIDDCGNNSFIERVNLYKYVDTEKPLITNVYVRDEKGSRLIMSDPELKGTLAYITAVVSDNIEVSNVEFSYKSNQTDYILIDEKSISSATGSCSISLNISALLDNSGTGPYTLRVRAKDTSNNDT